MPIFTHEQIFELLQRLNPWWQNGRLADELPKVKRTAYRQVMDVLTDEEIRRFAVLSGARRIGKTTVLMQAIESLLQQGVASGNIFYVSFDNPILKLCGFQQVLETYRRFIPHAGRYYFFLDEVQYADDWSLWVKTLYDTEPNLRLAATGSASPSIERGASDSGVGRWRVFRVPTMTFREFCAVSGAEPELPSLPRIEELSQMEESAFSMLMLQMTPLEPLWNRYLLQGGFPELVNVTDTAKAQQILREDVVDKVLKRDVPSLFDVRNSMDLEKVFLYLCLQSGAIINQATMSSAIGVSKPTLSRYIDYLRDANLLYISPSVAYTGKKGLFAQSKIYIADAALRNACLMNVNPFSRSEDMGMMAETAVYKHFVNAYGSSAKVGYLRLGAKQKEVDIAVDFFPQGERLLCEVKYKNSAELGSEDALLTLCREHKAAAAFVATKSATDFGITRRTDGEGIPLVRLPAATLCYLLNA